MGFVPSGDGIAAALLTLEALEGRDLADRGAMEKLPQRLVNVRVADRDAAMASDELRAAVEREGAACEGRGRVLVRPSGTEQLVRVMVEAPTAEEADAVCGRLVRASSRRPAPADLTFGRGYPASDFMCGIVGYVGQRPVQDLLVEGLRKLEYRGYDSAGVSVLAGDEIDSIRAVGNLANLDAALAAREAEGGVATLDAARPRPASPTRAGRPTAASTRRTRTRTSTPTTPSTSWSTASSRTTSPSSTACRTWAPSFTSETDAEVIAHLIAHHMAARRPRRGRPPRLRRARGPLRVRRDAARAPGLLVGARKECPLIVGVGEGERFLASAVPAFLAHTRRVQYVENGEIVAHPPRRRRVFMTPEGEVLEREVVELDWDEETAEKGGFETFMLKEIHEQADAVAETIADRTVRETGVDFGGRVRRGDPARREADRHRRLRHLATTAGVFGRYAIQNWARVPGRRRHRVGVPLRRPARRPRRHRHRHDAVRRDGGHARRDARGAGEGRDGPGGHQRHGLAGHARRRRRRSSPAPARRSASRPRRRSSARSRSCCCSRCGSPSCTGRSSASELARLVARGQAAAAPDRPSWSSRSTATA